MAGPEKSPCPPHPRSFYLSALSCTAHHFVTLLVCEFVHILGFAVVHSDNNSDELDLTYKMSAIRKEKYADIYSIHSLGHAFQQLLLVRLLLAAALLHVQVGGESPGGVHHEEEPADEQVDHRHPGEVARVAGDGHVGRGDVRVQHAVLELGLTVGQCCGRSTCVQYKCCKK